jgi:NADH-quinone oxidoreductase subunit F
MWRVLERMARGEAKKSEIDMLLDVSHQIEGHIRPALSQTSDVPPR